MGVLLKMATTLDNIKDLDPFAQEYYKNNPGLFKKHDAAVAFSACFQNMLRARSGIVQAADKENGALYSASERDELRIDEMWEWSINDYIEKYNVLYGKGNERWETVEQLDEKTEEKLEAFHDYCPDEYDREKYKEINVYMASKLGSKLLEPLTEERLTELTERAYRETFEGSLTDQQKKIRINSALSKIKRQKVLRNQMERFLMERQKQQAEALKMEPAVKEKEKGEKKKWKPDELLFADFIMDWVKVVK